MFSSRITDDVHELIGPYIKQGDRAIDLTVGNGHDTLFLAKAVGKSGHVIGIDIQALAINQAKRVIESENLENVTLYLDDHANITNYIEKPINVAMMNLGYLPKSDKKVITKKETTIKAIDQTLKMMDRKGIMSITVYIGHEGSQDEYEAVRDYLKILDSSVFQVREITYHNRENQP
ncbi:MAG: methyltransferase domain-containing protein, partial [Vallitaleaceae bacterium]|nr:methyltransferase domain-containing protein [Vallitaleaceae bacterium]